jgi:hypothetical protein
MRAGTSADEDKSVPIQFRLIKPIDDSPIKSKSPKNNRFADYNQHLSQENEFIGEISEDMVQRIYTNIELLHQVISELEHRFADLDKSYMALSELHLKESSELMNLKAGISKIVHDQRNYSTKGSLVEELQKLMQINTVWQMKNQLTFNKLQPSFVMSAHSKKELIPDEDMNFSESYSPLRSPTNEHIFPLIKGSSQIFSLKEIGKIEESQKSQQMPEISIGEEFDDDLDQSPNNQGSSLSSPGSFKRQRKLYSSSRIIFGESNNGKLSPDTLPHSPSQNFKHRRGSAVELPSTNQFLVPSIPRSLIEIFNLKPKRLADEDPFHKDKPLATIKMSEKMTHNRDEARFYKGKLRKSISLESRKSILPINDDMMYGNPESSGRIMLSNAMLCLNSMQQIQSNKWRSDKDVAIDQQIHSKSKLDALNDIRDIPEYPSFSCLESIPPMKKKSIGVREDARRSNTTKIPATKLAKIPPAIPPKRKPEKSGSPLRSNFLQKSDAGHTGQEGCFFKKKSRPSKGNRYSGKDSHDRYTHIDLAVSNSTDRRCSNRGKSMVGVTVRVFQKGNLDDYDTFHG